MKEKKTKKLEYSKRLVNDTRALLWVITIGGLLLAFYNTMMGNVGEFPWIGFMVSCAWGAHGTICSFYLNMSKSDHKGADGSGITFAAAQANGFKEDEDWETEEGLPEENEVIA